MPDINDLLQRRPFDRFAIRMELVIQEKCRFLWTNTNISKYSIELLAFLCVC